MTIFKEISGDDHKEYIFPCDCNDAHYLRVYWDEDPKFRALWIEDVYRPRQWRQKWKDIWAIITNHPVAFTEIILNEKTTNSLLEVLSEEQS